MVLVVDPWFIERANAQILLAAKTRIIPVRFLSMDILESEREYFSCILGYENHKDIKFLDFMTQNIESFYEDEHHEIALKIASWNKVWSYFKYVDSGYNEYGTLEVHGRRYA